jgi:hypothetical protein
MYRLPLIDDRPVVFNHFLGITALDAQVALASGYHDEGIKFYAYVNPRPDCIPVYRWFNINKEDHIYTTSGSNAVQTDLAVTGYLFEGIVFYVYPPTSPIQAPVELYESYQANTQDHLYSTNTMEKQVDSTWEYKGVVGKVLTSDTLYVSPDLWPVRRYCYLSHEGLSPYMLSHEHHGHDGHYRIRSTRAD